MELSVDLPEMQVSTLFQKQPERFKGMMLKFTEISMVRQEVEVYGMAGTLVPLLQVLYDNQWVMI